MDNSLMERAKNGECEIKVYVHQRPHMRDDSLEYELYVGRGVLQNIFELNPKVCDDKSIILSFPERWLNIVEERSLFARIGKYYPQLKTLTIKTQSVYIIQCCPAAYIRIVLPEGFEGKLSQEGDEGLLYIKNPMNLFNASGLNVVGGSVK